MYEVLSELLLCHMWTETKIKMLFANSAVNVEAVFVFILHWNIYFNTAPSSSSHTDLFGEVLDDAVLRHLGADDKTSLQLLLNARDHFLVLLRREALHS